MKPANFLFLLGICVLSGFGCDKQQPDELEVVIGTDPCTSSYPAGKPGKGYVIQLSNRDTVLTYNLPLSIAKGVEGYQKYNSTFFLKGFKTNLTYRPARNEEKSVSSLSGSCGLVRNFAVQ